MSMSMSDATAKQRMLMYRAIATVAVSAVASLAGYFSSVYPWAAPLLAGASTGVGWLVGKLLGIPMDAVNAAAIATMTTDRAVKVTSEALRSMAPAAAEAATRQILASIPPPPARPVAISIIGDPSHADTELPPPPPTSTDSKL